MSFIGNLAALGAGLDALEKSESLFPDRNQTLAVKPVAHLYIY
jgi:hypothetical protein